MKSLLAALRRAIFLFALLATANAIAVLPDSGWYWNPSESGRGFNIEIQDKLLFMSGFVYDQAGVPIWVVSGGPMTGDRGYTGDLFQTRGGQCIGCAYGGPPTMVRYGSVALTFTSTIAATVVINGTTLSLRRQEFGFDFSNPATPLLGEWATTEGETSFPVYYGDRIAFSTLRSDAQGPYAGGNRAGKSGINNIAVGSRGPSGAWSILLDSSTSYYRYYRFSFTGFNRIEGDVYLYRKGESPVLSDYFIAHRIKSAAAALGQPGPGTGKSAASDSVASEALARDDQDYRRMSIQKVRPQPHPDVLEAASALTILLESQQSER